MNIALIIGNGFDINLGLPTQYKYFYEYYLSLETNKDRLIRNDLENNLSNWADLEKQLGQISTQYAKVDSYVEDIDDYLNLVPATTDSLQRLSSFTSTKAANTLPSHLYEVIQTARLGMLSPYLYSFIDAFYRKAQGNTAVPEIDGLNPDDYVAFFSSVSPYPLLRRSLKRSVAG